MNTSEIKLLLFKEIDKLPKEILMELREIIQKMTTQAKKAQVTQSKRQFGSMKGLVEYMAPDFNEPLEEFKEYMPE